MTQALVSGLAFLATRPLLRSETTSPELFQISNPWFLHPPSDRVQVGILVPLKQTAYRPSSDWGRGRLGKGQPDWSGTNAPQKDVGDRGRGSQRALETGNWSGLRYILTLMFRVVGMIFPSCVSHLLYWVLLQNETTPYLDLCDQGTEVVSEMQEWGFSLLVDVNLHLWSGEKLVPSQPHSVTFIQQNLSFNQQSTDTIES